MADTQQQEKFRVMLAEMLRLQTAVLFDMQDRLVSMEIKQQEMKQWQDTQQRVEIVHGHVEAHG